EARQQAAELLVAALGDLPKVLVARARKPTPRDYEDEVLRLDVRVAADPKLYQAFLKRFMAVLDQVSVDRGRVDLAPPSRERTKGGVPPVTRTFKRNGHLTEVPLSTKPNDSFMRLTAAENDPK